MRTNVETIAAKNPDKKPDASKKPAAMTADAYNAFVGAVKSASFDKGKLETVAQGAASNYFTSAQVAGLMGLFSFDDGKIDAATLVAARLAGVERVYKCGGAQGIAAVAYGTETVPKCAKVLGPGSP
jgi:histidinol dehydrogenase